MLYIPDQQRYLSSSIRMQLAITQLLVLAPFLFLLPWHIAGMLLFAPIWVATNTFYNRSSKINRWLLVVICLAFASAVFMSFGTLRGKEAGTSLITLMYSIKLLESWKYRDFNLLLTLSFFILSLGFLFSQSFLLVVYIMSMYGRLLYSLVQGNCHSRVGFDMRSTAKLLAYSLPIMLILFVFFPRLPGPLWKMPGELSAGTGISDSMTPGDINSLNLLYEPAFRVKFDQPIEQDAGNFYWRGMVFEEFDGLTWKRDEQRREIVSQVEFDQDATVSYDITIEPTSQPWLFGLDIPVAVGGGIKINSAGTFQARRRIESRIRYSVTSAPNATMSRNLTPLERAMNLALPEDSNPETREWAVEKRNEFSSNGEFIRYLLEYINTEPYYYTLTPPIMLEDMVDDFWFNHREGFCEHYASSMVFILRAAGIPSRVVTGYQGGEYNEVGDFYLVRLRDAHAWTEYWDASTGWTRLDPTAAISPLRIDPNLLLEVGGRGFLFDAIPDAALLEITWLDYTRQWLDSVETFWQEWVIDFDQSRQWNLFGDFRLDKINRSVLYVGLIVLVAILFWFISRQLKTQAHKEDKIAVELRKLIKLINKKGLSRQASHPITDWFAAVSKKYQPIKQEIMELQNDYLALRYAANDSPERIEHFISRCRELRTKIKQIT